MPFEGEDIHLPDSARAELEEIARSQALPAGFVLRAKIVLLLAEGMPYEAIQAKLDTTAPTIARWKKRFLENGLDGFETQRPGQPPQKLTARLRGRISGGDPAAEQSGGRAQCGNKRSLPTVPKVLNGDRSRAIGRTSSRELARQVAGRPDLVLSVAPR